MNKLYIIENGQQSVDLCVADLHLRAGAGKTEVLELSCSKTCSDSTA